MVCIWFGILVGYRDIMCESDSKIALSLTEEGVSPTHPYYAIVGHIVEFKQFSLKLSFSHTLCESNSSANWLVKLGVSMDDKFTTNI